jgi:hypothetical protein
LPTKITCLIGQPLSTISLEFSPNPLLVAHLLHFKSLLFQFLFPLLLVNLLLERILHFLLLQLTLVHQDVLFVPSLEDCALLFKFDVHSIFSHSAASLEVGKVVFSLHRTVGSLV